ncbi:MAG: hypothetical protein Q4G71_00335 [Pseudomonadota bacterium]|nr:hypothetical protein [Pseudomonadota bacterium]
MKLAEALLTRADRKKKILSLCGHIAPKALAYPRPHLPYCHQAQGR